MCRRVEGDDIGAGLGEDVLRTSEAGAGNGHQGSRASARLLSRASVWVMALIDGGEVCLGQADAVDRASLTGPAWPVVRARPNANRTWAVLLYRRLRSDGPG